MKEIEKKVKSQLSLLGSLVIIIIVSGCSVSSPVVTSSSTVYRDPKEIATVTNTFSSSDLQAIAESMARSLMQSAIFSKGGKRSVLTLAEVKNKTSEYIDTRSITNSIRTQVLNSGLAGFAVDTDSMGPQVDECKRQQQSGLYKGQVCKPGGMVSPDYRLEGELNSIVQRGGDVKDVYYKFSLQLIHNGTGLMEWADEKEIRKTSVRPWFGR